MAKDCVVPSGRVGVFVFLKEDNARTLSDNETRAVLIERQRGIFRVFSLGEGLAVGKSANRNGVDARLRATRNDGIGIAVLDGAIGLADAVCARSASRHDGHARTLGIVAYGHAARSHVANHGGNHQGRNPPCAFFLIFDDTVHNSVEAADARSDVNAQAFWTQVHVLIVLHGLISGGQSVNRETVVAFHEALVDATSLGIEVL